MKHVLLFCAIALCLAPVAVRAEDASVLNVRDYGATPGGEADCTAAFQAALDAAKAAGGGIVEAPVGRYRFDGVLVIPKDVTLSGVAAYAPAHAGIRDNSEELPVSGSVLEPYAGAGSEEGAPFLSLNTNSTVRGFTVHYPAQDPKADAPTAYPYTVAMRGNNPALIDVQLLNPYNAIDASQNQRALIRNIHGQPIHIGIYVDHIYDIGRIENVHWNPWWSLGTPVYEWQQNNGTGFIFGKTDWHYVLNTFCFGYNVGYKFIETEAGGTNGNFLGIGADDCYTAVVVEQSMPYGILITNGEFVSFHGPDPTMVRVGPNHSGSVRFVNCAFWGPCYRIAAIEGKPDGVIGFSDCTFVSWGNDKETEHPAIEAFGGSLLVRGCEFQQNRLQVRLHPGVARAIIKDNLLTVEERIENNARGQVIIGDNVSMPRPSTLREPKDSEERPGRRSMHYRP
jgi:hypothetical protein